MAVGSWWLRMAVTATLLAVPPCAVIAQNSPTTTGDAGSNASPDELAYKIQRELAAKLTAPRSTPAQRDEAARRLLVRPTDSARKTLLDAITATVPAAHDQRVAVAKAIADNSSPDPQFVPALEAMLGPDRPSTEAAAAALVRYSDNQAIQQRLLEFVRDTREPVASREAAARAVGNLTLLKRPIATLLVGLAAENGQPLAVRNAALDALGDCTGFPFGHDAARWRQWLAAAPQSDPAWTAEVAASHSAHEQQIAREKDAYAKALEGIISSQYQALSGPDRSDERGQLILTLLNDADPHVRVLGITYCTNAFRRTQGYPPAANDRIQNLLGDSSVDVRLEAARAVQELNLVNALDAILAQLTGEPDADVRDAMVGALGHIGSPRAIPTLRVRLSDSSMHVAMTAAYWLGELAAPLRNNNPQQADQITAELWKAQNNQINNRDKDAIAFRAACIEAIGKLKDPKLDESILRLGEQAQEPVGVRVAAYRALASTHNRRASIRIARDIQNENPANKEVRIAEVNALAATGKFEEEANFLYDLTQSTEPDPQVRAAAWDAFKTLLPTATDFSTLTDWSARLSNDPARQLAVLDTLTEKLKEANRMNDWAPAEQNRGAALMALAQHDPSTAALTHYNQAATAFLAAVDFWNKSGQQVAALPGLAKQAIEALLEAHDYSRACTFAADQLKVTPLLNQFLGPEIRDYADRLVSDGKANRDPQKLRDAIDLIEQATKIDPPLEKPVLSDLNQFKADAENAMRVLPKPQ